MGVSVFRILRLTFQRFNSDRCWNSAIVISYYVLLCAVPLIALFAYITTKVLGSSEFAFRSLNLFSEEFFASMDPAFFGRLQEASKSIANLGLFGLAGSFISASFLFSSLIYAINFIFKANYQKSFFYNRLMEYVIMFMIGIIMLFSLAITAVWAALHRSLEASAFFAKHINPEVMTLVDNVLVQYIVPFALTFLVFFSLYKFIPEVRVHTRSAALAAVIAAILWEVFKRGFAFYVVHLSVIGIVLSKTLQGSLTSIIFFLLWISFSLAILLWGAELASVHNDRLDGKLHEHAS
jgi:membrane protein